MNRILWLSLVVCSFASALYADPVITFSGSTVTVQGLDASAQIVLFGVEKIPMSYMTNVQKTSTLLTADATGTAVYPADHPIPENSVWVAVDINSGAHAAARPHGTVDTAVAGNPLRRHNGVVTGFSVASPYADGLYVQPGSAVETMSAGDGDSRDADGTADARVELSCNAVDAVSLKPGWSSAASYAAGGVFAAIDYRDLSVSLVAIDSTLVGGAQ